MADTGSAKTELVALAKTLAETDLYALLQVPADASADAIHRAWRRAALKNHPDKAGAAFDAAKYERLEQARNVLCDDAARSLYDGARSAAARRASERSAMDAQARRFADELERAERAAGEERRRSEWEKNNPGKRKYGGASEAEVEALRAKGRQLMAERKRAKAEREQKWEQEARRRRGEREAADDGPAGAVDHGAEPTVASAPPASEGEVGEKDTRTEDERMADLERRLAEKLRERAEKKRLRKAAQKADAKTESAEPPASTDSDAVPSGGGGEAA